MKKLLMQFVRETEGQDLIEYALLAATISIAVVAAMQLVASALNTEFSKVATSVTAGS
jgi:Flp pilus assembly pilin Flp